MNKVSEYETLLKGKISKLNDILQLTSTNIVDPEDIDGYIHYVNYIDDKERIFQNVLVFDEKIALLDIQQHEKSSDSLQLEKDIRAVCQKIYELDEQNLERANNLLENVKGEIKSVKKQKKVNSYGAYLSLSSGGSFDTTK